MNTSSTYSRFVQVNVQCHILIHIYIYIYISILILISYYINGYDGAVGSLMLGKVQCIVGV